MKIIELAKSYIGTQERTGNNDVIFNDWYYGREVKGKDYSWCVVFIAYLFNQMGIPFCDVKTASTNYVRSYAKKVNKWVTKDYKEGDLILFDWNGDGVCDHIGIFCGYAGGNQFYSIEGNTNGSGKYDGVYYKTRNFSSVLGAYRPDYPVESEEPAWAVEAEKWSVDNGLFKGDGKDMRWGDNITRREVAVLLYRLKNVMD